MYDELAAFMLEWEERLRNQEKRLVRIVEDNFAARERELRQREERITSTLGAAAGQITLDVEKAHFELEDFIRSCRDVHKGQVRSINDTSTTHDQYPLN